MNIAPKTISQGKNEVEMKLHNLLRKEGWKEQTLEQAATTFTASPKQDARFLQPLQVLNSHETSNPYSNALLTSESEKFDAISVPISDGEEEIAMVWTVQESATYQTLTCPATTYE